MFLSNKFHYSDDAYFSDKNVILVVLTKRVIINLFELTYLSICFRFYIITVSALASFKLAPVCRLAA